MDRRNGVGFPIVLLFVAGWLFASAWARGADLRIGDDQTYLKIGLLLQGWAVFADEKAPDGESQDTDLYLRRMRLLFSGQLNPTVNFFVETDNPNFGMKGDFSSRTFVQDAWMELNLHRALQIDVGMLLVPFSHHGMQGAVSLHSLDYHGTLIRYPQGSHQGWRDFGVMLRGMVPCGLLEYRLAILNGVHGSPPDDQRNVRDWPRLTARLTLNLFEAEGGPGVAGFFYDGLYLKPTEAGIVSPRRILSFGASLDWQKDLNVQPESGTGPVVRDDYLALAADVFLDWPLTADGLMALAGQVNFFYYDYGPAGTLYHNGAAGGFAANATGYGLLGELGLRYDAFELVFSLDWFEATEAAGDAGDLLAVYGGFNWWWFGHSTSIKLQLGSSRTDGKAWAPAGTVQAQLLF